MVAFKDLALNVFVCVRYSTTTCGILLLLGLVQIYFGTCWLPLDTAGFGCGSKLSRLMRSLRASAGRIAPASHRYCCSGPPNR